MKIKKIFSWMIRLCQVLVGLVVIETGFHFARGSGAFFNQETDSFSGGFIIIIGIYFVFSGLTNRKLDRSQLASHSTKPK